MDVVDRPIKAVNYRHRSGATKIDFKGTRLAPNARGEAKVESKRGYIEIEVEFRGMPNARTFGSEYLTYVMWAISPEGRAQNLGEVLLKGDRSKLNVTTELQAFGLVLTAEPYFSVTMPSDVIVLENEIRQDTKGKIEEIEAKYELLKRGQYTVNQKPDELSARLIVVDSKSPLELYEARNAIRIARWQGADKYAAETFQKAVDLLIKAEEYQARKRPATKPATMTAREAVQTAEDARLIAVRRQQEEHLALERLAAEDREAAAKAAAEHEAQRRAAAERDKVAAEQMRMKADAARDYAEKLRQQAEKQKMQAQLAKRAAIAEAHRAAEERAQAEAAKTAALEEAARIRRQSQETMAARDAAMAELDRIKQETARQLAELERAKADAQAQQRAALSDADSARREAEEARRRQAEAERQRRELRQRLQEQLNAVLETTNTTRGLIVNMSDVLFDTAKFQLRPAAREKLAKISGLLLAQPGLRVEVEGHTDSVGSLEYNQNLSERRAASVREFLVEQGIGNGAVSATGFGETRPKADNETASGRQANRRVELVVSGDAIETSARLSH